MTKEEIIYRLTMYNKYKTTWGFIYLNFKPDLEKIGRNIRYDKKPKVEVVERKKIFNAEIYKQDTFEDIEILVDTIYLLFGVELDETYFECGEVF